jgi:hypothetical protein
MGDENMDIVEKEFKSPVIVISGDHGTGKSYVHKKISKYIQSVIGLNKYDFITRKLLFILNIHPLEINYVLLNNDMIDRELYQNSPHMKYLRSEVEKNKKMSIENFDYFLEYILEVPVKLVADSQRFHISKSINELINIKHRKTLKSSFFSLTKEIFKNIITKKYDFNHKDKVYEYLDSRFIDFKNVYDKYQQRVVYYAYSPHEVSYFKDRYSSQNIYVDMKSHLQTQLLVKDNKYDSYDEVVMNQQYDNINTMKKSADIVIVNNLEMDKNLVNKIMTNLNI